MIDRKRPPRSFRARWILPIERPPVENGWIQINDGRIVALGSGPAPTPFEDLGDVAVLPGLVNAHTHLELSWMAGLVPPSASMDEWIRTLLRLRRAGPPGAAGAEIAAAREALTAMRSAGTVLVGDITNSGTTAALIHEAGLGGVVFRELLGFSHPDPERAVREAWDQAREYPEVAPSVVAHAPYSVSPALFRAIAAARRRAPLAVHLAESAEEMAFIRTGGGPIREMLEHLDVWDDGWAVPGGDPLEYLQALGYVQRGTLIVHGVHLTDDNLRTMRKAGAVLVTCPRSNVWVGAGSPPITRFYNSGVAVAIGTDSLASAPSLSVFDELAELRRIAPEVAASALLESATRVGAEALGRGDGYGTIAPGKRAALIAVAVPLNTTDVEEYLVSAVAPQDVRVIRPV